MIVKELQNVLVIYIQKKTITTDRLFIIANIRIYFQIDADEFQGLSYTILSEEPFKNQRIHTTEEKYDYTTSDYISQHFGMLIGETMTYLSCHQNNWPQVLKYDQFIMSLGEIS